MIDKPLYRSFKSKREANEWGDKYYKKWALRHKENFHILKNFVDVDADIIRGYCGMDYRHINAFLRDDGSFMGEIHYTKALIQMLACEIMWAPRVPENIVVYRSVPNEFVEQLENAYENKGWAQEKGFLSTSLYNDVIENDNILRISIPKGVPAVYAPCIADGGEFELLLLPNNRLRFKENKWGKIKSNPFYNCELEGLKI